MVAGQASWAPFAQHTVHVFLDVLGCLLKEHVGESRTNSTSTTQEKLLHAADCI